MTCARCSLISAASPGRSSCTCALTEAWPEEAVVQQAVGQIPWGHNIVLLTKLKDSDTRLRYAAATVKHGWSRNILTMQIETKSIERQGKAVTNFDRTLPAAQSDLARESLKDPYKLDFLGLEEDARTGDRAGAGRSRRRLLHRPALLPPQAPRLRRHRAQSRQVQPEHIGPRTRTLTVSHNTPVHCNATGTACSRLVRDVSRRYRPARTTTIRISSPTWRGRTHPRRP
jgi:hypothetical protein